MKYISASYFVYAMTAAAPALALFAPVVVSAQAVVPPPFEPDAVGADSLIDLLNSILIIAYNIFFILAVFFILWGAFLYLTARGDEDRLGKAKQTLIYAVVAIVIALLAFAIPSLVATVLEGSV